MREKDRRQCDRNALEQTRITAVKRVLAGETPKSVMAPGELHPSNIYRWLDIYKKDGFEGLKSRTTSGRPSLLGQAHEKIILENVVNKTPLTAGYKTGLWTRQILSDFLTRKTGTKIGVTAITHFLKKFSIHHDRPLACLRKKTAPEDFPELAKAFQLHKKQAGDKQAILYFCTLTTITIGSEKIYGLSATTAKGQRKFFLYNQKISPNNFSDWLERLMESEEKNVALISDDPNIFVQAGLINLTQISQKIIFLETLPVIPSIAQEVEEGITKHAISPPRQLNTIEAHGSKEATDLSELSSLMNKSILEPLPWYSFLKEINSIYRCRSYISVNIHLWNSVIRPDIINVNLEENISVARRVWSSYPLKKHLNHPGDIAIMNECCSSEQLHDNPYYRDLLNGFYNRRHEIALCISGNTNAPCVFSLTRSEDQGPFGEAEKKLLRGLLSHLQVAMETYIRLRQCELSLKALHDTTSHIEVATFILDGAGNVINQNRHASRLIEETETLWLDKNRIVFSNQDDTKSFYDYVRKAIAWRLYPNTKKPIGAVRVENISHHYLGILIQPIEIISLGEPAYITSINPHVIIHVSDPNKSRPELNLQQVSHLFSLSIQESQLATLLTNGKSLEKAAQLMNITLNTARTYLQRAYSKLGVNNRADLIQLISKSVASY